MNNKQLVNILIIAILTILLMFQCTVHCIVITKVQRLEKVFTNVNYENPRKGENDKLSNEVDKLEIIKKYESDKALNADDSTTVMLWKQLVSE